MPRKSVSCDYVQERDEVARLAPTIGMLLNLSAAVGWCLGRDRGLNSERF